eukprot:CAMPEP_0206465432 /NCGR_PEP_ID=MMETSP0324_2-20121206/27823_1 /ASSEMBLY_ACC=CAM_ASM_000836 /TAXON_ID=2866 /ORGANISM="Crypthecodinium cohnii, Strain Seligo" /LENGTH=452 /DNA_ID=CAMNT_0053938283 /DNA_START=146 /DNA_END=1504 /DNA_ORIENTATION=+
MNFRAPPSPSSGRQTAWWWVVMFIGYTAFLIFLGVTGRTALQHEAAAAGAAGLTFASKTPYSMLPGAHFARIYHLESSGKTIHQQDYSDESPIMGTSVYTREGMAWVDELLSTCKKHRSAKPGLVKILNRLANEPRVRLRAHKIMHRFGRLYTIQVAEEGMLSVLDEFFDLDEVVREEVRSIRAGHVPLTAGQPVKLSPKLVHDDVLLVMYTGAFLHGVLESFVLDAGRAGLIQAAKDWSLQRFLPLVANDTRLNFALLHSLGHAFWDYRWSVHQVGIIEEALDMANDMAYPDDVYAGALIGHFHGTGTSSSYPDSPAASISVCYADAVKKRGNQNCLRSVPIAYLILRPRAYVEALKWCWQGCYELLSGSEASQCEQYCVGGVAMETVKENLDDVAAFGPVCEQVRQPEHVATCVQHAKDAYLLGTGIPISDADCSLIESQRVASACREVQ